jgi:hypothetical protein
VHFTIKDTGRGYEMKIIRNIAFISISTAILLLSIPVSSLAALMSGAVQGTDPNLTRDNASVTTLAGLALNIGSADGTGSAARFKYPDGITTDGTNLYVVDRDNYTIRKIMIATGAVTTIAGLALNRGSADGIGSEASFNLPSGITTDGTNLYVADSGNSTIRKIVIATGVVTTLAGLGGTSGSTDGTSSAARFHNPYGITTDGTNLYVADCDNHTIRKIVIAAGAVTTLAGSAGTFGSTDGTGSAARFYGPHGITTDGTNLYVVDRANYTIRKMVIATGVVTTLAGKVGTSGRMDGTGAAARFDLPEGITTDGTNLYVADTFNTIIRKIVIATGVVTILAGWVTGSADGTGFTAAFRYPSGITTDGTNLYVADTVNHTIRTISASGADTTPPTTSGITALSPTNSLSIPVTITASDNAGGSGVAAYLITNSPTPPTATASGWSTANPYIYTVTTDNTYTLYGWAKDAAENVSSLFNSITVTVDRTTPLITGTSPAANTTGFEVGNAITATFSEAMDASTINSSTFTVKSGISTVTGAVSYDATTRTATFKSSSALSYNTNYAGSLLTGLKDTAGNSLGAIYAWSFTTQRIAGDLNGDN